MSEEYTPYTMILLSLHSCEFCDSDSYKLHDLMVHLSWSLDQTFIFRAVASNSKTEALASVISFIFVVHNHH